MGFFSFEKSKGRVAVIIFWASWKLPACEAEISSVAKLYDDYKDRVDFYLITNEEREPVQEFLAETKLSHLPITYLIIGDPSPIAITAPPSSYIIDKQGAIAAKEEGISDWNSAALRTYLDNLLAE